MLLHRLSQDDVQVLVLRGRVADGDVPSLSAAVHEALDDEPRGVVIDLTDADAVEPAAVDALVCAAAHAGPWPRPSVAVCGGLGLPGRAEPGLQVHPDRSVAMAHVDDRAPAVRCRIPVQPGPQGPGQARRAAQTWLAEQSIGGAGDDVLLLVSELVTNALRHGLPPVVLELCVDARTVSVAVVDAAPVRPRVREVDPDAEGGRGMLLLTLLSLEHGVRPQPPGKVVWGSVARG